MAGDYDAVKVLGVHKQNTVLAVSRLFTITITRHNMTEQYICQEIPLEIALLMRYRVLWNDKSLGSLGGLESEPPRKKKLRCAGKAGYRAALLIQTDPRPQ